MQAMSVVLIIVIGWLYVTVLVAFTEHSFIGGLVTFFFSGALPCGLIVYFAGSRVRRERRRYLEQQATGESSDPVPPPAAGGSEETDG
jgi:hypothetical protein